MVQNTFNPERLKEARIYRDFSLEELGKKLGVSKQMISKYEQGLAPPNAEALFYILQALRFPREFFYSTNTFSYRLGNSYFRALLNVSKKEKTRQLMKIEWIATLRHFLEKTIEFPEISLPDLPQVAELEEKALLLREAWGLSDRPIVNMVELLEEKGFVVTDLTLNDERMDAFSQRITLENVAHPSSHKTYYVIVLGNNKKSFYRRQFDAAHELAHLLLHEDIEEVEDLSPDAYKEMEREANQFAGLLLLSSDSFRKDVAKDPSNLNHYRELKMKWKVSISAMIVRAWQLGVIDYLEYQKLFKALSRKGWRKQEPFDNLTPQASPRAFGEAMELLFEEGLYSPESFLEEFFHHSGIKLNYQETEQLLHLEEGFFARYISTKSSIVSLKGRGGPGKD